MNTQKAIHTIKSTRAPMVARPLSTPAKTADLLKVFNVKYSEILKELAK